MYKMEGSVVLRYAEPLDEFLKIRKFSSEEITRLLAGAELHNRSQYEQLVLNACFVSYFESIQGRLRSLPMDRRERVERGLYELAVDVNPDLDIKRVSIPVAEPKEQQPQIHLIEESSTLTKREKKFSWVRTLEEELNRRVIGQAHAAERVARGVRKAVAGIRDPRRPVGSFMFVGQTGVGKTEMANTLADIMFGSEGALLRLDCSEYALPHEYAKLIGAPPGYIGYNEGGHLTEKLKQQKGCILLFDEIEKADRKVHNLLLQMLDEGFLTDSRGQRVACAEAVIILTSNIGVEKLGAWRNAIGFRNDDRGEVGHDTVDSITQGALKDHFPPEFLNRIDEIVTFRALAREDCRAIVELMLQDVVRHARHADLRVSFSDAVPAWLADRGYAPEYGARELRRTVKRLVEAPLSDQVIEGKLQPGSEVVVSLSKNGELTFKMKHR